MHGRGGEQALDGVVLPLGEGAVELGDGAELRTGAGRLCARIDAEHLDAHAGVGVGAARIVVRGTLALGARAGAGGLVVGAVRGGKTGVGAALGRVLFHEHRHHQLDQHQQGVDQGAALGAHLARGAQRLEARLQRIELRAQRRLVHRRHGAPTVRPRPPSSPPTPRCARARAAPRSAGPSSGPCA